MERTSKQTTNMKIEHQPEHTWERLKSTALWAETTERRNIEINKADIFWIIEELSKWEMIKGRDLDLPDVFEAEEQQPITDEDPL
jgi:hypothetical protein